MNKEPLSIKIKYHADIYPIRQVPDSDWIDLRAAEDVFIPLGETRKISLGVSMELPEGYEAIIAPRSSTFKNLGLFLTNGIGIIDNAYHGDNDIWQFPARCEEQRTMMNGKAGTLVRKNDRICQFRLLENQPRISFAEVDHLEGEDRGGFGSTGRV